MNMLTGTAQAAAPALRPMVTQAVMAAAREDGWASLSQVGSFLLKTNPSFDPRNYGCQKLGELIRLQKIRRDSRVSYRRGQIASSRPTQEELTPALRVGPMQPGINDQAGRHFNAEHRETNWSPVGAFSSRIQQTLPFHT